MLLYIQCASVSEYKKYNFFFETFLSNKIQVLITEFYLVPVK